MSHTVQNCITRTFHLQHIKVWGQRLRLLLGMISTRKMLENFVLFEANLVVGHIENATLL